MTPSTPEAVKEILRQVPCPGLTRDIVALGFIKSIAMQGDQVRVEFTPDVRDVVKILTMEDGIRAALDKAHFEVIEIETEPPYDDTSMLLGGPAINPLQVDFGEYGIDPKPDLIEGPGGRARNLISPEAPSEGSPASAAEDPDMQAMLAADGPQGASDPDYDGALPVFQWQVAPEAADEEPKKVKLSIDSWNFGVSWTVHPVQDLVYASLQARHWIKFDGKARPNPSGRVEGVNLVYDLRRDGVVAIYGTVKDFRPFVEAFRRAYCESQYG